VCMQAHKYSPSLLSWSFKCFVKRTWCPRWSASGYLGCLAWRRPGAQYVEQPSAVMPRPRRAETSVLANALKKDGFTIISMCPGWVQTDMGQRAADEVRPPATTRRAACCLPWRLRHMCPCWLCDERLWTVTLIFADAMISFIWSLCTEGDCACSEITCGCEAGERRRDKSPT